MPQTTPVHNDANINKAQSLFIGISVWLMVFHISHLSPSDWRNDSHFMTCLFLETISKRQRKNSFFFCLYMPIILGPYHSYSPNNCEIWLVIYINGSPHFDVLGLRDYTLLIFLFLTENIVVYMKCTFNICFPSL